MPELQSAGLAHCALLSALHSQCFADGWTEETFAGLLVLPGCFAILAAARGDDGEARPAGLILVRLTLDEAEILSLGVLPDVRRGGIGRALLNAACARLCEAGAAVIFLEVAESNHAARRLYAVAGFAEVGRRAGYYRTAAGTEAALVLRRDAGRCPVP